MSLGTAVAADRPSYASLRELRRARRDPVAFLQRLALTGDAAEFSLAGQQTLLLSHPAAIEDVLVTHGAGFAKPPALDRASRLLGRGLLTVDNALHADRRRAIGPAFHAHRMDRYAGVIAAHADRVSAQWESGGTIDIAGEMTTLALSVVGETFFSTDFRPLAAELRGILSTVVNAMDPLVALVAPMRRLRPARQRLHAIVQELVDRRTGQSNPPDDLLTLLLQAQGDTATWEQLLDDAVTMMLAGHDTIANALTWTWGWLAAHPDSERRFHAELDDVLAGRMSGMPAIPEIDDIGRLPYTRAILSESLRLSPPAWILARRALEDCVCGGVRVPAGALVVMSPYLVHRDPRFYQEPLAFNPRRWERTAAAERPRLSFFPFGAGRRSCVGESFAWMEGMLVLATVGRRWRILADGPLEGDFRITLRPRTPVSMRAVRRG